MKKISNKKRFEEKTLSITIDGETKIFHDKNKFIQYLSTNLALQRIIDKKGNYAIEKARK